MRVRLARQAIAACVPLLNGCASPPAGVPQERWSPGLVQLVPGDVDVVARIDLSQARRDGVDGKVRDALVACGLSGSVIEALSGCFRDADVMHIALRLGPNGTDGDTLAVVTGASRAARVPCDATGWVFAGKRGELEVFEPREPSSKRSAGALLMRSERGEVLVATLGQVDAVFRVLRDGPDAGRLEPKGDGIVVIVSNARESLLPETWRRDAATLIGLARGLKQLVIRVGVGSEQGILVRAELVYVSQDDAQRAGDTLKLARDALAGSGSLVWKAVGQSAHASLRGDMLRAEFVVPNERVVSQGE